MPVNISWEFIQIFRKNIFEPSLLLPKLFCLYNIMKYHYRCDQNCSSIRVTTSDFAMYLEHCIVIFQYPYPNQIREIHNNIFIIRGITTLIICSPLRTMLIFLKLIYDSSEMWQVLEKFAKICILLNESIMI